MDSLIDVVGNQNFFYAIFLVGMVSLLLAIIGKVKDWIDLDARQRRLLAIFGVLLMALGAGGYFYDSVMQQNIAAASHAAGTEPNDVSTEDTESPAAIVTSTPRDKAVPAPTLPETTKDTPTPTAAPEPKNTLPAVQSSVQPGRLADCSARQQGPLSQGDHSFAGPVHVVQLWRQGGDTPWGVKEVMAIVIGDLRILRAGGYVWTYPDRSCTREAEVQMRDGASLRNSTVVTAEELRDAGLIE